MMPFLYPIRPTGYPVLVVNSQTHIEDNDDDDEEEDDDIEDEYLPFLPNIFSRTMPIPMTALSRFVNIEGQMPVHNDDQGTFRLRMNVDGFQPNELNVSIRHGRLIIRGKHIVQADTQTSQPLTTSSIINANDDAEPDFVAKEFKRSFIIPPNADVRKAHAQFYPQQQLLIVDIPFQNSTITRIHRLHIRSMDIFLIIVTILLMDRALRITYEQFMINEHQLTNPSSQYRREEEEEEED